MGIFKSIARRLSATSGSFRWKAALLAPTLLLAALSAAAQATFLGSQTQVGGPALSAPAGIAADGAGNVYVADTGNNRVVEIAYTANGYAQAQPILTGLSAPGAIAADWYGNLYIADTGNNRVVKLPIAASGFGAPITVATGLSAPAGVVADSAGDLFIADTGNNRILELPASGAGFGAPAVIGSGWNGPQGLAVDTSRNLYIADTGNNRVVKELYSTSGYLTQQVAVSRLAAPLAVAVDNSFNLYIAQSGNQTILEEIWLPGAGRFNGSTLTGSGFISPRGLATDAHGNLWVADAATDQPWLVVSYALAFPNTAVNAPGPVFTYNFNIAAGATLGSAQVFAQGYSGLDFLDAGGGTCLAQTYAAATVCSIHVQFRPLGPGLRNGAVILNDSNGNVLSTSYISGVGSGPRSAFYPASQTVLATQLSGPSGVAVDGAGNVYIADTGNNRILELAASGAAYRQPVVLSAIQLNAPMGLAIDGAGNLYIASNGNDKIVKLPWNGTAFGAQSKVGAAVYAPSAVVVDGGGNLFIADSYNNRILKLPWTGNAYATPQLPGTGIRIPMGVAVDNSGNIYLSMPYQNRVVQVPLVSNKYQPDRILGLNAVASPTAVVCDGSYNLYILDTGNNRVVMLPWNGASFGAQVTVAAGFNNPSGMAIDGNGNLYVADTGNNRVVRVNLAQPASVAFPDTYVGAGGGAQVVTLQNTGNLPLSVGDIHYPADFPESAGAASDCANGDTLTLGGGCTFSIDFSPQSAGSPLTEAVSFELAAQGAAELTQSIPVTGTALPQSSQAISFTPIANVTYGSAPIALHAAATSGLPVTFQVVSGPAVLASGGKSVVLDGAGTVVVAALQPGNSTYQAAAPATCSFTVARAVLTVTPASATAVYGAIPSTFAYSITGMLFGQNPAQIVSGQPAIAPAGGSTVGVGTHALVAALGTLQAANYSFAFAPGILTVTKATLRIAASPAAMAYGGAVPAFAWSAAGFVNGDTAAVITGAPALTTPATARSGVGSYAILPALGTLQAANYTFVFVNGVLTVHQAVLTVTAQNQTMTYGAALPALGYTLSGFLNSDTAKSAVNGAPALAAGATSRSAVGSYAITPSLGTLSATNYTFAFVAGTLTVARAPLTITPNPAAMTYGGAVPALKSWQAIGLLNGDTAVSALKGAPVLSTAATSATPSGSAPIAIAAGTLTAANYSLTFQPGTLTIQKAILTVTPAASARLYGQPNPAFAYTLTGFVNGDTAAAVSGAPVLTAAAAAASPIGKYTIAGAAGTLTSPNYTFAFAPGILTVNRAPLTITANALTIPYGSTVPTLTYSVSGLVNGDTDAVIAGSPILATSAPATPRAATYPIAVNVSKLSAANYTFVAASGQLTVTKAVLTVTPSPVSMTYGGARPTIAYQIAGFVLKDTASVVTGAPAFTTAASSTAGVGVYPVTVAAGSLAAANYTFQFTSGTLTVKPAVLTVTAAPAQSVYGSALPTFTYAIAGLVNGDKATVVTGAPTLATAATAASPAGVYPITAATGTLAAANYTFNCIPGQLTIAKAQATVTAANQTMTAGGTLPTLTYTVTGLVNGDTAATALSGSPALSTTATSASAVGSYTIAIAAGTLTAKNYTLAFVNGTLTVSQSTPSIFSPQPPPRKLPPTKIH